MSLSRDLFQKGYSLHQRGEIAKAQALYRQVLAQDPGHFDSLHLLGLALIQDGNPQAGADMISKALAVRSDFPEAYYNLGNALLTLGRAAEALDNFTSAIRIRPDDALYHLEAGNALKELKRNDAAISHYDLALALDPGSAEAHNNRGIALKEGGRLAEAVASYDRAIALRPRYAEAHSNRGNALKEMGRLDEALVCHETAIGLRPDYAEAHYNRGNVLGDLKRRDEALASYDEALRLEPDHTEAQHNKSLLLLGAGRFAEGFALYSARWKSQSKNGVPFVTSIPRWHGDTAAGRLLLWAEQGIGDEIFYSSLLSLVPMRHRDITLAADRRLHPIYERSLPGISLIASEELEQAGAERFAAQAPNGDLGLMLGLDEARVAARRMPFLKADGARREAMRAATADFGGRTVCGLSWKSGNKRFGAEKSIALMELAALLTTPGMTFVNLQYGDVADEIAEVRKHLGVEVHRVEGLDVYNDIDGLLALVDACDVILTTSNVTAHLAGALGKPGVVLVPAGKGSLWYWQGGLNNLWYPSLRRVAQDRPGHWKTAIETATASLRNIQ